GAAAGGADERELDRVAAGGVDRRDCDARQRRRRGYGPCGLEEGSTGGAGLGIGHQRWLLARRWGKEGGWPDVRGPSTAHGPVGLLGHRFQNGWDSRFQKWWYHREFWNLQSTILGSKVCYGRDPGRNVPPYRVRP